MKFSFLSSPLALKYSYMKPVSVKRDHRSRHLCLLVWLSLTLLLCVQIYHIFIVNPSHAGEICDPILHSAHNTNPYHCILPLPNDFYLRRNEETPTGFQIQIPNAALPRTRLGRRVDMSQWNKRDGWAPSTFIVVAGLTGNELLASWSHVNATDDDGLHPKTGAASKSAAFQQEDRYSFASHMFLDRSLEADSPTVLIDAETGEKVRHWVTLDHSWAVKYLKTAAGDEQKEYSDTDRNDVEKDNSDSEGNNFDDDPKSKLSGPWLTETILIHPARKLKHGHRYVVGLRHLRNKTASVEGEPPVMLKATEGFRILRDDLPTNDPSLLKRRRHFEQRRIFDILAPHQLENRSEWILSWDFTTASLASTTEHLRFMREDAFQRLEETDYPYTITRVVDNVNTYIARQVHGYILAPNYLETTTASLRSRLVYDDKASTFLGRLRPVFQGWTKVPFILWIPHSATYRGAGKASLLQYGHGLFQSRQEGHVRFIQKMANEQNFAYFTGDWWGLQSQDLNTIAKALVFDFPSLIAIPERSAQGILNNLMLMRVMRKSSIHSDPLAFLVNNRHTVAVEPTNGGRLEIKHRLYYGLSLGGILGTVYMAMSPDVKVGTLSVPAGPFALVFPRNDAGSLIITKLISIHFPNSSSRMAILFLMNHMWELNDPLGYTDALEAGGMIGREPGTIDSEIDGLGPKKLLIQLGISDTTVNGIASGYLVRSLGAHMFPGNAYEKAYRVHKGLVLRQQLQRLKSDQTDPFTGFSVLHDQRKSTAHHMVSSFHFEETPWIIPFFNYPATLLQSREADTHELVRLNPLAQRQVTYFFGRFVDWNNRGRKNEGLGWVRNVCGSQGCWNLKKPDRSWNRWDIPF